jgi:hypothetical protein
MLCCDEAEKANKDCVRLTEEGHLAISANKAIVADIFLGLARIMNQLGKEL